MGRDLHSQHAREQAFVLVIVLLLPSSLRLMQVAEMHPLCGQGTGCLILFFITIRVTLLFFLQCTFSLKRREEIPR